MTAALLWDVLTLVMAGETQIVFFSADRRFQQLVLVIARVRIVAGQAFANRRLVNRTSNLRCVLFGVATEAQLVGRSGDQFDAGDVAIDPNFVAAQASHGDGGVDRFPFALIFVAFEAFRRIDILVERHGVGFGHRRGNCQNQDASRQLEELGKGCGKTPLRSFKLASWECGNHCHFCLCMLISLLR